jgi:regulator of sigma E protease
LQEKIRARAGEALQMTILRAGRTDTLHIVPAVHEETNPIETVRHGRIGISAVPRTAEVTVVSPESPAGRAGLRTFDKVVKLDGQPIANWEELAEKLARRDGPLQLEVLRQRPVAAPGATLWSDEPEKLSLPAPPKPGDYGLEASDLTLFAVQPGSAAEEAGLKRGDRVVRVGGVVALSWGDEVESALKAAGTAPLAIVMRREGREIAATVRQHLREERDDAGVLIKAPDLGALPDPNSFGDAERIWMRYGLAEAARRAVLGTAGFVRAQSIGIARILTGRISSKAIGGPLMIADVARKAAEQGWRDLIVTMGAISVVLGLMNLLPVPVLDGFHVLSAAIEGVRRRPLSLRFREVANLVGIAMLIALMLFAFRNDALRWKWFE